MPGQPEGAPCWADVMVPDLETAKNFYGELLGWTFDEGSAEFGYYTQAYSGGKKVAALAPPMPGGEEWPPAWTLYFASPDADATVDKIRNNGGQLLMEPMDVGDFGRMALAQDPDGAVFGVWQGAGHMGFEKQGESGAVCWSEAMARDTEAVDAFYPAVFPLDVKTMDDPSMDYKVWQIGDQPVAGRFKMTDDIPADTPPHFELSFGVDNCDDAVTTVAKLGGQLLFGPMDSPFGRFASVKDPQGAAFSVIDMSTTSGDMPGFK